MRKFCGRLVERSAQNHRDDSELGFGRHAHGPRHHVVRHTLAAPTCPMDEPAPPRLHPRSGAGTSRCRDHRDSSRQRDCQSARQDDRPAYTGVSSLHEASMSCRGTWHKDLSRPLPSAHNSSAASLNNCAQSSACSIGPLVGKQHGCRRKNLHFDAVPIHLLQAALRDPSTRNRCGGKTRSPTMMSALPASVCLIQGQSGVP